MIETMLTIQSATLAARKSTGDANVGTQVDCGRLQVVRAVPRPDGLFDITPLSGWMPIPQAVEYLRTM